MSKEYLVSDELQQLIAESSKTEDASLPWDNDEE